MRIPTGREPELAALRRLIQEAGEATDRLRMLLGLAILDLLGAVAGFGVALAVPRVRFWQILAAAVIGGLIGFLLRYPIAAAYRGYQSLRLRRRLADLSAIQREELLALLSDDDLGDTQKLAVHLLGNPGR